MCASVQNGSVNVDSVVTVAARLAEAGHYGAERIAMVSSRLQEDWKSFTSALEERSNTLAMATGFHQGAEQVMIWEDDKQPRLPSLTVRLSVYLSVRLCGQFLVKVEGWVQACSDGSLPSATAELEAAVKKHQELNEEIAGSYTQVPVCFALTCLSVQAVRLLTACASVCRSARAVKPCWMYSKLARQRIPTARRPSQTSRPPPTASWESCTRSCRCVSQGRYSVNR